MELEFSDEEFEGSEEEDELVFGAETVEFFEPDSAALFWGDFEFGGPGDRGPGEELLVGVLVEDVVLDGFEVVDYVALAKSCDHDVK